MMCVECSSPVDTEWRRMCCGCGAVLHDACWIDRLSTGREPCPCGGGWNLFDWSYQVTICAPEEPPPGCRCDGGG